MILQYGSVGSDVARLQMNLNFLGFPCGRVDNQFGPKTETAVRTFQIVRSLQNDGRVRIKPAGETWTLLTNEVSWVQSKLKQYNYYPLPVDGIAGNASISGTRAFQTKHGLVPDGIAGGHTRAVLERPIEPQPAPVVSPAPSGELIIHPRGAWAARPPKQPNPTSGKTLVIVHHTESGSATNNPEQELAEIRGTQNYHMNTRGWNDIGYGLLITRSGAAYEGRGIWSVTAACKGYNTLGLNVAMLGSFTNQPPTAAALTTLNNFIAWAKGHGPKGAVGHRDKNPTNCPGDKLQPLFTR